MKVHHFLLAVALAGCCDAPDDTEPPPVPSYCEPPPFARAAGTGLLSWALPSCSGDVARGEWAVSWPDPIGHHCSQFDTGEVWCADLSSPVPAVYYRDPNAPGQPCVEWLPTQPWYVWRSCGAQALPATPVDAQSAPDPQPPPEGVDAGAVPNAQADGGP